MTSMLLFCSIHNKTIVTVGLSKGYQPQPLASDDNPTVTLIILDITKTSSNNCLKTTALYSPHLSSLADLHIIPVLLLIDR